ncbi:hypothetical protein [Streptomyces sp. XY431]|uniref:hypothetical protein n=1 Tax=Streptomyces sp. XY431 TaxID=1415562 RepID=UPI0006B01EA9|nr:hypothetical protein [Streptomyces sp. XY431]
MTAQPPKKKKQDIGDLVKAGAPKKEDTTNTMTRRRPPQLDRQSAAEAKRTMTTKYVQLRTDQTIDLDLIARDLQAARTRKGERITANTVIRVAVDTLLSRGGVLVGDTEEELLASLTGYLDTLEETRERVQELEARISELEESQST